MSNYIFNPKYLERIKRFTLLDDTFMRKVFEDNIPAAELLLHIILKNDKLKVKEVRTQAELKNLVGHSSIQDDTALGHLMSDFYTRNPRNMYYHVLAERALYFKESRKGVAKMCKIMEELRDESFEEGLQEGIQKGIAQERQENHEKLLNMALLLKQSDDPIAKIMTVTGLSEETIKAL